MQNLGSSAVKNTYLHTKQPKQKKDQTDGRNIYVFWGQGNRKNQFRGHGFMGGGPF